MKPLIMFVDDDPMILASIHRQLSRKMPGYDFVFCDGASKALAEAEKRSPDVLFSDMRMPGMDGLAFLTVFSKHHPLAICFAMTGQVTMTERAQIELLVRQVLNKPVACAHIAELIESAMAEVNADD